MSGKFTLDNFYQSGEWSKLLQQIKLDRVNGDGQLICWHCGKPITKAYDCIGHHTIYLTDQNVNDYEISLNADLIQLVHHRCHNKIHNKFGYKRKEIYLVYGSPLSGKSTFVNDNKDDGDLIVDIDNIWECVSGGKRYEKPPRLNAVVFAVRDKLLDCVKYRTGKWNNAYIIGGYPLISERERICKEYGAREIYIDCSYDECLSRLELAGDRDKVEWKKFIDEWWRRYTPRTI
jgi:hypothetical protein